MIALANRPTRNAFRTVHQRPPVAQRNDRPQSATDLARRWTAIGGIVADLAPGNGTPPRLARLNISIGLLPQAPAPWAARFWEQDAPPGVRPVEWLLGSRSCVTCLEDALELLDSTEGLVTTYALA